MDYKGHKFNPKIDYCSYSKDSWFGISIKECCFKHDVDYAENGEFFHKCIYDIMLGCRISLKGFKLIPIGILYMLATLLFGGYAWRKHRESQDK